MNCPTVPLPVRDGCIRRVECEVGTQNRTTGTTSPGGPVALWHGAVRPIAVIAAEGQPLIGMALLRGSRLSVEALPGGEVTVSEL